MSLTKFTVVDIQSKVQFPAYHMAENLGGEIIFADWWFESNPSIFHLPKSSV